MNQTLKLSFVISILFLSSCNTTKNKVKDSDDTKANSSTTMENEKFIKDGYIVGLVAFSEEGKCVYTITDTKTNEEFDPVNFTEIAVDELKHDAIKVYFKFRRLRMMNRCENLQPIELLDIKKRED